MPGAFFLSLHTSGQHCFCITVKKCQKLYELNEFYGVTEVTSNKGNFPENPDFFVLYLNFEQNQVTAPCNNCLAWHVLKDHSSVLNTLFLSILMTFQRFMTKMTLIVGTRYFRQKLAKNWFNKLTITFLTDLINLNT